MAQTPPPTVVYGATYIVAAPANDSSIPAMYARLMPLAKSAGFDDLKLIVDYDQRGSVYSAHAQQKPDHPQLLSWSDQIGTAAEAEERITDALYEIIGRNNTASL